MRKKWKLTIVAHGIDDIEATSFKKPELRFGATWFAVWFDDKRIAVPTRKIICVELSGPDIS